MTDLGVFSFLVAVGPLRCSYVSRGSDAGMSDLGVAAFWWPLAPFWTSIAETL